MNKSSEIYDIAWDLASIVDNLDDSVLNVIRKGTQGTDPNASASLELACLTLNKNIEQLKSLVASLEEITYSLEEELDKEDRTKKRTPQHRQIYRKVKRTVRVTGSATVLFILLIPVFPSTPIKTSLIVKHSEKLINLRTSQLLS